MLARRIIAISPDKAFGKQLATALKAAGGAVDLHQSLDELGKGEIQAALFVVHLDGELARSAGSALPTAIAELLPRLVRRRARDHDPRSRQPRRGRRRHARVGSRRRR